MPTLLTQLCLPARVDISGGWTDTPPQSYEWGGVVVTLALTVDGEVMVSNGMADRSLMSAFVLQYPIKSVAQRIPE